MSRGFNPERAPVLLAALLILIYTLIFSALGIKRYESTFSHDWRDEAVNNQMMFNTAHGRFFFSTVKGEHRHHRHFRPVFLFASLPYLFIPDARAWYFLAALVTALGGVAAYRLGARLLGGAWSGFLACALWLCWPALHEITLGNMDPETLVAAFWLAAVAFYVEKRFGAFIVLALCALCCKETQAPILAAMGLIALVQRRSAKWWAIPMVLGSLWFFVALKLIIPAYHPTFATVYNRFIGLPELGFPASFFAALMARPADTLGAVFSADHLALLGNILRSLGYFPLLAPLSLIAPVGLVTQILLHKEALPVRQVHMISGILPFVFWAALAGVRRAGDWLGRLPWIGKSRTKCVQRSLLILMIVLALSALGGEGLFGEFQNYGREPLAGLRASNVLDAVFFTPTRAEKRASEFVRKVPPETSVAANARLLLLLSNRERLIEFGTQDNAMELGSTELIALWFLEVECRSCTYTRLSPKNLRLAGDLVASGRYAVAVFDPAFAILVSPGRPTPGFPPQQELKSLFLDRVEELAGRLDRAEGLPYDEKRGGM